MSSVFAWVTPAFVKGMPVDHTWVTSYDSRNSTLKDLPAVMAAKEDYWFCWGSFHAKGGLKPKRTKADPILQAAFHPSSRCLVTSNDPKARGTIWWYGIHGVCHQVSNQVLFPSGVRVSDAKGYQMSSTVFGTYGRRTVAWNKQRVACGVAAPANPARRRSMSLLYGRARRLFGRWSPIPLALNELRRSLVRDIDEIGFAGRVSREVAAERAMQINRRITEFVEDAADITGDEQVIERLMGVSPGTEVNLVDPDLFEIPDRDDRNLADDF